jgi:hypothetical protein
MTETEKKYFELRDRYRDYLETNCGEGNELMNRQIRELREQIELEKSKNEKA